jgi:signal transduction histidine kinase
MLRFRVPIRHQITGLLVMFIGLVVGAFYYTTSGFLVSDKTASVRELQTLKVTDLARQVNDRVSRARVELRETGLRLLDPTRGAVSLNASVWQWVQLRDLSWRADNSKPIAWPEDLNRQLGELKDFALRLDQTGKHVLMMEPLRVSESGKESLIWVLGSLNRGAIVGEASRYEAGPLRIALLDASLESWEKLNLWGGTTDAAELMSQVVPRLPEDLRKSVLSVSAQAFTSEFWDETAQDQVIVSKASVPVIGSASHLIILASVAREQLLAGYRKTIAEQAFWAFMIVGFAVFAAGYLSRRLSKPIESMVAATKVLQTGNFNVRVESERRDELGDLASAFNHMGKALDDRERALKAAQNALVQNEKLAALGTLSAGIAHEVKNPLAGILGHADMSIKAVEKLSLSNADSIVKHLETIQKETKRCRGIIDSLMRFSRQEKAEMQLVDVEVVAWEAIHLMEHTLNLSKVKVDKAFSDDVWMIMGNGNQVEQVLLNMLQNAGHAMPKGGTVTVGTEYFADPKSAPVGRFVAYTSEKFQGPFVRLYVQDSGVGMTEEVQRKIFEPFFTTKPAGVGTGLGLSVTMGILGDHGARVSINSAPGKGTAFLMDFSAKQKRTSDVRAELEEIRTRKGGGAKLASDVGTSSAGTSKPIAKGKDTKVTAGLTGQQRTVSVAMETAELPESGAFSEQEKTISQIVVPKRSEDETGESIVISPIPTPPDYASMDSARPALPPKPVPTLGPKPRITPEAVGVSTGFGIRKPRIKGHV